jgi:hypothetical protein
MENVFMQANKWELNGTRSMTVVIILTHNYAKPFEAA